MTQHEKNIPEIIQNEIKEKIAALAGRPPCLAVILAGNHLPSKIYVNRKVQACKEVGIKSIVKELPESISEKELLQVIQSLNKDPTIDGILVQLPLPSEINSLNIIKNINPLKDVDGLHPINAGKLLIGEKDGFIPCTPLGIKVLLERLNIPVEGKHVVILGRSNLVGKPLAALLLRNEPGCNATVTVIHSHTKNIHSITRTADILIAAIGKPHFITKDMVKDGVIIIDVGINKMPDPTKPKGYRIVGDADYHSLKDKCFYISPVPGGVGPMTIAMLLNNTLQARINNAL